MPSTSSTRDHSYFKYIIILFAIVGGYLSYDALSYSEVRESGYAISTTFQDWLYVDLIYTRIGIGALLLIFSPFILNGAFYIAGVDQFRRDEIFTQSMLFFTFAYLLALLPSVGMLMWASIVVLGTWGVLIYLLNKEWKIALAITAIHWGLIGVVFSVSLLAVHGMGAITQWPAILKYSSLIDPKSTISFEESLPISKTIQWQSTGSAWLDEGFQENILHITVKSAEGEPSYAIEFKGDDGSTHIYETILLSNRQFHLDGMETGVTYTLNIRSDAQSTLEIKFLGGKPITLTDSNPST